jgi:hypothetical protein
MDIIGILEGREVLAMSGVHELFVAFIYPALQTHWLLIRIRLLDVLHEVQLVDELKQVRQDASHCKQEWLALLK